VYELCSESLQAQLREARQEAMDVDIIPPTTTTTTGAADTTTDATATEIVAAPPAPPATTTSLPPRNKGLYLLTGVVTHKGRFAESGHYVSYVRKSEDSHYWWKFDDDKVSETITEEIMKLKGGGDRDMAYLCFYSVKS
jgi:ubiquitin carboxyl-terminal hydrolase 14